MGIDILGYYSDNGENIEVGYKFISKSVLCSKEIENILVQVCDNNEVGVISALGDMGIKNFISFNEYSMRMLHLALYKNYSKSEKKYYPDNVITKSFPSSYEYISRVSLLNEPYCNIICMPPKTGDVSIIDSLNNSKITETNSWHNFAAVQPLLSMLDESCKIRVVTAVRDPIAQNISSFFQALYMMWESELFWADGGDIQTLFDFFVKRTLDDNICMTTEDNVFEKEPLSIPYNVLPKECWLIQTWFDEVLFKSTGIDIFKYPFDKERGYTVISEGRYEIFVYQLEKLNSLGNELALFFGKDHISISEVHGSRDKWYGRLYSNALKQLSFTKDYYESCIESNIVKHCYSDEDRRKIIKKWENNVKRI